MLETKYKDLMKLTRQKRMQLADELWASATDHDAPPTAEQKRVLDQRWNDYKSGKMRSVSYQELKSLLKK